MIGAVESLQAALRTLSVVDGARMSAGDRTRVVRRIARSLQRSSYLPPGDPVVRAAAVLEHHADSPTRSARCAQLCSALTNAVEAARRTRPVVLIVEDEPFTASMLHAALSSGPFPIRLAGSATEAQRAVGEQRVGAIILDLQLGNEDGRDLLDRLRHDPRTAGIPLLVLTAQQDDAIQDECLALGASAFLTKPARPVQLRQTVAQLLMSPPAASGTADADPEGRATILLVEDDPLTASLLRHRLERDGFEVLHADDGDTAWQALQERPFDLALLDVKLPGTDGFELLQRCRADPRLGRLPIVVLTMLGREKDVVRGFSLGADDYVVKPFSPVELVSRLRRLLSPAHGPAA